MSGYTGQRPLRIAVGQIADYTGKAESDNSGRKITQGAALMAMSALSQGRRAAGRALRHLGRRDGAQIRQQQADRRRIRPAASPRARDYRQIIAGSIPGSDYYLVGGITELNFNIRSEGASGDGGGTATNRAEGPGRRATCTS